MRNLRVGIVIMAAFSGLDVSAMQALSGLDVSAMQQQGHLWWNVTISDARRDLDAPSPTFVVYGAPRSLEFRWEFKNDGTDRVTITPSQLHRGISVNATQEGSEVPAVTEWDTTGKATLGDSKEFVNAEESVVLQPGEWIEWGASLVHEDVWLPGIYRLRINIASALSTVTVDGRPWRGRAVQDGTVIVQVDPAHTLASRIAQTRIRAASLLATGRRSEAVKAYRALLELAPNDLGAHAGLGLALIRDGQFREGAAALEIVLPRALSERSTIPETLAYAYVALNDERNAERVLRFVVPPANVAAALQKLRAAVATSRAR